jgi:pimeloyl-[acyl-carrier protein] methyl ester esterase
MGNNWLLLRGLARESAHWGGFTAQLQASFPAASVHTLDLPGTGQFFQTSSPADINGITRQVRTYAQAQGLLDKPVNILAVSLGAMVAWEWLQQYPEECNRAVLLNTSFAHLSPFYQRLRWQSYGKLVSVLKQTDVYQRELSIVQLVSNRTESYQETARAWADIQTARPIALSNLLKQLQAAARYRPSANAPKPPVLLLNGLGDRLVAPECSTAISKHYHLPLHSHPWAGHDLTADAGDWVIARLQDG